MIVILIFAAADVVISLIFSQSFYLMLDFPGYSPMEVLRGSYKIMKGVEVDVPGCVAEVLENSRMMADTARHYVDTMAN